ncbi:MAG: hypothetical protein QXH37_05675, partial [Candidatus Bathyarchaeia archaeon]
EAYSLSIGGNFVLNLATYSIENISSIEIYIRFKTSDTGEYWILEAYNWINDHYDEVESLFPPPYFRDYTLSLGDNWQRYVNPSNGAIKLIFHDETLDSTPTIIDIDFIAVKVVLKYGTVFTFKNEGASTAHIVAIWVNNATVHKRYDVDLFINSGETITYIRGDISLPYGDFVVKVVTDRGNIAVFVSD